MGVCVLLDLKEKVFKELSVRRNIGCGRWLMNKSIINLSVVLILFLLIIEAVSATNTSTGNSSTGTMNSSTSSVSSGTISATTPNSNGKTPYKIPGGTGKFVSKQNMRKKLLDAQSGNFPYDINEAIAWVRANKISLSDPTTKKSLFVNIMSDEDIASYLFRPIGLKLSGIENSGLAKGKSSAMITQQKSSKPTYGFSSHREDVSKELIGPGQSGKKELPYYMVNPTSYSDIPQSGNINEEYAWLRTNLQSIYDPFKKKQVSVTRTSEEYLRYLLKSPQVRRNLGLPALPDNGPKKSASYK